MAELEKINLILAFVVLLNIELISSQHQSSEFSQPAININTNQVQFVETPNPLTLVESRDQTSNMTNTGTTMISRTYEPYLATLYGGLLNHTYLFCQDEFYWDLELKPDAGFKIDGIGSPVQVFLTFSKDGCKYIQNSVQIVTFIYVDPFSPAPLFDGFESITDRITEAGSSTYENEFKVCQWFFSDFSKERYYMYTASNGAIVIVIPKLPKAMSHKMSPLQFFGTLGKLKNHKGGSYSHKAPFTTSPLTIVSAQGIKIIPDNEI